MKLILSCKLKKIQLISFHCAHKISFLVGKTDCYDISVHNICTGKLKFIFHLKYITIIIDRKE